MDAVVLREKLHSLETLMNKLLDKEVRLHKDCIINNISDYRETTNDDVVGCRTAAGPCGNDCQRGDEHHCSPNPLSWEKTMCSLAKELETICSRGSSPRDSPNISPCLTPTNGIAIAPKRRTISFASGGVHHQGSFSESVNDFSPLPPPLPPLPPPAENARPVRVRHEETEDRLDRSLTIICRHNSPHPPPPLNTTTTTTTTDSTTTTSSSDTDPGGQKYVTARNAKLKYRDSAKYGIRFRLDLSGRDPDQTTVSVDTEDHILRVYSAGEMIHLLQLAENTNPQTLWCSIVDGSTLFVRQRSKEIMCIENDGDSEINLPIVRHDEFTLTTTITLRLPPGLNGNDDIIVKTIDDSLMIRAGASTLHETTDEDTADHVEADVRFCVVMNLPEGTDSRSVCAWVAKGQLTVKGQLIPASRRMTCAF